MGAQVAVAVVSWNTRELLAACLRSLEHEVLRGRVEAWVVDNASTDGSAEMVVADFPWAQLVASERNLGFGPAVNVVARRTDAPWIAPANADVELAPGVLDALLHAGDGHPGAGILAPRLRTPDGATQHSVHPFPRLSTTLALNLGLPRLRPALGERLALEGHWDPERPRRVDWAHGALLLVRRSAWEQVGGFDDTQWMYAEDLDLCWRAHRAGWSTRYVPGAVVAHHLSAATTLAWGGERVVRSQRAAYAWMAHRRGPAFARLIALVNMAGAGARWAALTPAARLAPERHAWRHARLRVWVAAHRTGLAPTATLRAARGDGAGDT
jgi:GT2 family glycosyltransferase